VAFALALGLALLLTPIAALIGRGVGLVDRPEDVLKIHRRPIPLLGGAAVLAASGTAVALMGGDVTWWLAAGALVAFGGGLVDDALSISAGLRILILLVSGVAVSVGSAMGTAGVGIVVGVTLLVVACANAVNIVDGQDGLAGGLAAIAALGFAVLAARIDDPPAVVMALALAGSLVGFLVWNWPLARVFLGNGGAYAVGVILAILATRVIVAEGWRGLFAAGACLGVFAFEVLFTAGRRLLTGGAIAAGDRLHSYDLLSRSTGRRRSTVGFWAAGVLLAVSAVLVLILPLAVGTVLLAVVGAAAGGWGARLWGRHSTVT
jgi:UDP-GlcNAc:undecaprenyl-phosphate GlcNAc-1-phosphate transferase